MSGLDLGTGFALFLPRGQASGQATQIVLEAPAAVEIPPNSAVRFFAGGLRPVEITNASHAATAVGFSVSGSQQGQICKYVPRGSVAKASGLTAGQNYFLDEGGGLTITPPQGSAAFSLRVGQAVSDTQLAVELFSFAF